MKQLNNYMMNPMFIAINKIFRTTIIAVMLLMGSSISLIAKANVTKQLYLSDPSQALDRVDPVATADGTTVKTPVLSTSISTVGAAAYSNSGQTVTTHTFAYNSGTTGINRALFVGISYRHSGFGANNISSVTYGGQAMTLVGEGETNTSNNSATILCDTATVAVTVTSVNDAPCNEYSPWVSPTYAMTVSNKTNLFGADTWSNKNNLIDDNTANASSWTAVLLGSSWIESRNDPASTFPAGSYAGFVVGDLDLVSLGASMKVSTYNNDILQEEETFASLVGTILDGGKRKIGFVTTKPFNRIRLTVNAGVTLVFVANAYYAEVVKPCAGAALECNTTTPLVRTNFGAIIEPSRTGLSGLSVGMISNVDDATNSNTSDYAILSLNAGILGSAKLSVRDLGDTFTAGTFAGFDIENADLISLSAFNSITLKTYLNGTLQEQKIGTSLWLSLPLLDTQNRTVVGFETTKEFNEIQIEINQPVGLSLGITKVFSAVVKKPCEGAALVCNTPTFMTEPNYPVNINTVRTGVTGIASAVSRVNEPDNVLDSDLNNYATLSVPVTVGTIASLSVLKSLSDFPAGTYAGFDIQNVTLLNVQFLQNITLNTYNNGVLQESVSGNGILLGAGTDLLASDGRAVVGFVTTKAFDELQISLNNVLSVDIGNTRIYKMVVTKLCEKTIDCNSSYYLTQPDFPVVLNAERTGIKTLGCVACSVNNPDNVIDSNISNYSRITLVAGVVNSGSISVLDPTATYPKGTFAGFTVKDRYFLVQGDLFEFITVRTYNNGVLQESKTSTDLIDLTLLIPILGTGTKNVGFYTTKDFDEVQIETVSIASVINILDVYGAFIDTRSSNGTGLSCTATLVANPDTQNIAAGSTGTVSVLANDTYNNTPATTANVTISQISTTNTGVNVDPATGLVTVAPGTPAGTYVIDYQICDNVAPTNCDTATVTVTVINNAPVIADTPATTNEDTPVTVCLPISDVDAGSTFTASICGTPTNGTLGTPTVNGNEVCVTYTPAANYSGTDTFCVQVCDNGNPVLCDTATVTVTVTSVNDAPIANNDTATTPEDTAVVIPVLNNDSDVEGLDPTTVAITDQPNNGTVSVNPVTGEVTYTPNPNFNGTDTFEYQVCDNGNPALCDTATVTVTVTSVNDAPVIADTPATTNEDTPVTVCLPISDVDTGSTFTASVCGDPTHGTISTPIVSAGQVCVTYTPAANYSGTDTFCVQVCDNGNPVLCDVATVTVTVTSVNDAPIANNDTATTPEDTAVVIPVLNNDSDVEGLDPTTVAITDQPNNGTVSVNPVTGEVTYTPNPNFNGTDTFEYQVCDNGNPALCDTATVTVTVTSVNDAPVIADTPATTNEDTPVTVCLPISDVDTGSTFTASVCGDPTHGTISTPIVSAGQVCVTYTPAANYSGTDTFCVQVCDNGNPVLCDVATVTVTVTSVNDAPIANNDTATTPEDTAVVIPVLNNDSDVEGLDPTTVAITDQPNNGTVSVNPVTGEVTYTPNPNFNGTDTFEYQVCDNGNPALCDTATVTVTVTSVNDAPVIADTPATTNEDTPVTVCLPISDVDTGSTFTASVCGDPTHGTISTPIVSAGQVCVTYTPAANYSGTDTFCVQVCDNGNPVLCDVATVTVTVTPANDAPIANNDTATTPEDTAVAIPVLNNDSDVEGLDPTTVAITDQPNNGTVSVNPVTGEVTYTPNPNFNGTDTFEYQVCDNGNPALCDTATVTVTVTSVNDAPVIADTPATTNEDTPVTVCLPISDVDTGSTFTASVCGDPTHGTISTPIVSAGQVCVTYTPAANYSGTDTFCVQVCDNGNPALCDTATVTVTVTPANDAPIANNDTATTPEDTAVAIPVLNNDSDVEGLDPTTVAITDQPNNGTVSVNPVTGEVTYTPNPNFNGTDTFEYQVCDNGNPALCDTATVTVTVTPVNDAPVIADTPATTNEDTPVTVCLPISDVDTGSTFTASVCGDPTHGTISTPIVSAGQVCVTYTPAANYSGTDTFCVQVCDNGNPVLCDVATVTVTVTPANDAPIANNDTATTPEDTAVVIPVLNNDSDVEGLDPTTVAITDQPNNGTVSVNPVTGEVTYTPNPNFNGTDTFEYQVCDNGNPALCDTATVTVTVTPVNDAPVIADTPATTNEDTPVTVCLPISDVDTGSTFTASVCGDPTHGTISAPIVSAGQVCVTYTPAANYSGTDTFCVQVCDNGNPVLCDVATVTVTVTPANDAPIANNDTATTPEDTAVVIPVLNNDSDVEGLDPTTVAITDQPNNGTVSVNPVTGEVTYTPNPNFNGTDTFEYQVCDNGNPALCDTATVTVTVTPVNDAPVIADTPATTNEDTPVTVCLPISDVDTGSTFTASVCGDPTHGTISTPIVSAGQVCVTYTPAANYSGTDTFCVQVCDNGNPVLCDVATVTVTVTSVNDAPIANNDTATTPEDTAVVIPVLNNDSDVEGLDPTTVAITDQPNNGTVSVNPVTGEVTYTPNPNFNGTDTFEYQVCDNGNPALCDTATVTVTVTSVNDAPVIADTPATTNEDTPVTVCLPISDVDTGSTFTASVCGDPTHGTISTPIVSAGQVCVTYTPAANYSGTDTFCVQVCDNGNPALCDTATVTVTVTGVNDAPIAVNDATTTTEDTPVTLNVTTNDTDLDGTIDVATVDLDPATAGIQTTWTVVGEGTYTVDALGVVTFTPVANFNGIATPVDYTVNDNDGLTSNIATITITVDPVNDPPVANDDGFVTPEDVPVNSSVAGNDTDVDGNLDPTSFTKLTDPVHGTLTFNPDGSFVYTPALDYVGPDQFTYQVCDLGNPVYCDQATVTIDVGGVNDPPVANDDNPTTPEDTPVTTPVVGNDTDPDNNLDPTSVTIVTPPVNGIVTVDPVTGAITYTPNPNFNGTDTYEYEVCDLGIPVLCDVATVTVTVTSVNDAPVIADTPATTNEDTPVTVCLPISDVDTGSTFTASVCGDPTHGTISAPIVSAGQVCVTYTPAANYSGTDTFCVQVCDNGNPVLCDVATVTVTVTPANDAPIANNDTATTPEDTAVVIPVLNNDSDVEGLDPTTVAITDQPNNGTVSVNPVTGEVTYTPNPNFNGTDTFEYQVCDNGNPALCDTATVTVTVTPVNDAPVIADTPATTNEDTPVTVCLPISDVDTGSTFTASVCGDPTHGTISAPIVSAGQVCVTYTPAANYSGTDTFCVQVCDNGNPVLCDVATVTVTVTPANDAPIANNDTATTPEDTAVVIPVLNNDSDVEGLDPTTVAITDQPNNGTVSVNPVTGEVTYTPNPNFNGTDTFEYQVCDNGNPALCDTATVTVTVTPVNDAPVIADTPATTNEDTPVTVCLPISDVDTGSTFTASVCGDPTHGTISTPIVSAGQVCVTYTPAANYSGTDTFCVQVCDNGNPVLCDVATVTVTVTSVNDAPIANNDTATTPEDTAVVIPVLNNDSDVEGLDPTTVAITDQPNNGTVSVNPVTGEVTYTPNPNFNGTDTFEYQVCDNGNPALCDTATVTVTVTSVNDAPVIADTPATTNEDTPVTVCLPISDVDTGSTFTASVCGDPTHGTISTPIVSAGQVCVTYTPAANYSGTDTFCVQVCDNGNPVLCDVATVTVTVTGVNDAPIAVNDATTTTEDTPVTLNVTTNDTDLDGTIDVATVDLDPATAGIQTTWTVVGEGTYTVDALGVVTFTPVANFNGIATPVDYTVNDNDGLTSNIATITITVDPVNDPPVANDDGFVTPEDVPVNSSVAGNDTDVDGNLDPTSFTKLTDPVHGTLTFNPDGSFVYTPALDYVGPDQFTYQVCDLGNPVYCDQATVTIDVGGVNDPPVANDDNPTTPEDTPVTTPVVGNDTDPDNNLDPTSVTIVTPPVNGIVTVDPVTGAITYTPNPNFNGTDTYEYEVCDLGIPVLCDVATVTVTVTSVNDAPVIADTPATTNEDTPVTVCLPISDVDTGSIFTASVCGDPTHGTISTPIVSAGQVCVTYTPAANYSGTDTFCVQVCDNGNPVLCDVATVTVTVTPANDAPIANNDTATTPEDTAVVIPVLNNDSDVEGLDPTTVAITDQPNNGTVSVNPVTGEVTYTPNPNFNGTDTFEYQVCDNGNPALCDTATVTVTVTSVNDAPVIADTPATTNEDTPVTVCLPISDVDTGSTFTASVCGDPTHGTISTPIVSAGQVCVTYTPAANYSGTDTFCVQVCDNGNPALCDVATVTVTVTSVNDAPIANNDTATTPEDTAVVIPVLNNDSDVEGLDPTTVAITDQPNNGTVSVNPVTGVVTYTPNPNFNGTDTFEYQVCDNGNPALCDTATVTVTVTSVNDAPVIADTPATTNEDTPVTVCLPISDVDTGSTFTASVCGDPTHGTISTPIVSAGQVCVTYTPAANYSGTDTFCVQVCDNGNPVLCDVATVTVTVTGVNDAPIAVNDATTTTEDTPVTLNVTTNDTDLDGTIDVATVDLDPATAGIQTTWTVVGEGTYTVDALGVVTFTPVANFNGIATPVDYTVNDNDGLTSNIATITITVDPVNDPPVANDDGFVTPEDVPVNSSVAGNDTDVDGNLDPTSFTKLTDPVHGTLTFNPDGSFVYTPALDYVGPDQFTYQVCDLGNPVYCDQATVTIDVGGVNDPPVANDDNPTTPEDTPVTTPVVGNDTDPDNNLDPTSVTIVTPPVNGIVTVDPVTGAITYTPNPNFNGTDTYEYEVCDLGIPVLCDVAMVTVTVTGVNDAPVAVNDATTTTEDTPVTLNVTTNDTDLDGTIDVATVDLDPATAGIQTTWTVVGEGTYTVDALGVVTFTPVANFNGIATPVDYTVNDNDGLTSNIATITITVDPVNDPPVALNDVNNTFVNTPVSGNLLVNDSDPDGNILLNTDPIDPPDHGLVTIYPNGTYDYTPATGYIGTDVFTYEICDDANPPLCDQATVTITITQSCVTTGLKVLLEGPFVDNGSNATMTTKLNNLGYLPGQKPVTFFGTATPAGQPYSAAPWNYNGTEGDTYVFTPGVPGTYKAYYPANATDWVLVSLRTGTGAGTTVCKKAALLLNDGTVQMITGFDCCELNQNETFYVVVEHRNHLIVMSHVKVPIVNGSVNYDFTIQNSYIGLFGYGQKLINGKYVMFAGNGDQLLSDSSPTDINVKDKDEWLMQNGDNSSYYKSDFELNGDVNVQDKVYWLNNNGKFSDVDQ